MKTYKNLILLAMIPVLAIVGSGVMYLLVYVLPMSEDSSWDHWVYTLVIIALGLAVPYWMLKLWLHEEHLKDPEEEELKLRKIPAEQIRMHGNVETKPSPRG